MGRGDLSDDQWAVLEPLLPAAATTGRPSRSKRMHIDGIRWRVRTGAPWRDLPPCYGPWQTVYGLFRRWQRLGVWAGLLTKLQARANARGRIGWTVNVDSTICRTYQHAAGATPGRPGPEGTALAQGISRAAMSPAASGGRTVEAVTEEDF